MEEYYEKQSISRKIQRICKGHYSFEIKKQRRDFGIITQLLRSGTSIGANIHEGNYAQGKADFISKFEIALKECYETEYWLELFFETNYINEATYKKLQQKSGVIRRILISSIKTAKENMPGN